MSWMTKVVTPTDRTTRYFLTGGCSAGTTVRGRWPMGTGMGADTITAQYPVVAMVFGQSGLMAGASIAGTKYTRIIPATF